MGFHTARKTFIFTTPAKIMARRNQAVPGGTHSDHFGDRFHELYKWDERYSQHCFEVIECIMYYYISEENSATVVNQEEFVDQHGYVHTLLSPGLLPQTQTDITEKNR